MSGHVVAQETIERWRAAWPQALAAWSRYTRLHDARYCLTHGEAFDESLTGSFAMIRLNDQSVVINLQMTGELGLDDYATEILAHEIGHHVLAPGNVTDQIRLLARIRRALPTLERHAAMVANLYTDLYINDRLQRQAGLRMAEVYERLKQTQDAQAREAPAQPGASELWTLYMGIYERLWQLRKGSLGGPVEGEQLLTDAWLGARLIRVYSNDWLAAAGRFASLVLPYLIQAGDPMLDLLHDTRTAAEGSEPMGGLETEDDEIDGVIHPAADPLVTGDAANRTGPPPLPLSAQGGGQMREPFEYGEILRSMGVTLSEHEIAVRYYRQRALPYLVKFPTLPSRESAEPQLEGLEPWELGDPLDDIDWMQTIVQSPRVIPGVTTVRRTHGREPAHALECVPLDLDMYVDSSGSMPDPRRQTSWLTLAGAIIALSALRAGSNVQATLWSGKQQIMHTDGFVRDEDAILHVLTGFYGGATAFPIHHLRETWVQRARDARPAHLLMISDDGITTMFDDDERGNSGWNLAAQALARARGGGTMALHIPHALLETYTGHWNAEATKLRRARDEQGWDIHAIERMEDLLAFARAFAQRHYDATSRVVAPDRTP